MNWRPWIVATTLLSAVLLNAALLVHERLPEGRASAEVERLEERLRHMIYASNNRRANLEEMGFSTALADRTAGRIQRLQTQRERFTTLLEEQATELGQAFCFTGDVAQPYAALQFLVREENGRRDIIPAEELLRFEPQPWFNRSPINAVYSRMEQGDDRRADATVMGVAALLLGREDDVIQERAPFGRGLLDSGGLGRLTADAPKLEVLLEEYFALMHYLTELANAEKGICS